MKLKISNLLIIAIALNTCAKKRSNQTSSDKKSIAFESKYFTSGQPWLYNVTVINASQNHGFAFIGLQSGVRLGKFEFSKNRLDFVAVTDNKDTPESANHILNSWKINSDNTSKDTNTADANWNVDGLFHIDWESAEIRESKNFPYSDVNVSCYEAKTTRIDNDSLEFEESYISFTLIVDYHLKETCMPIPAQQAKRQDNPYIVHYKYSFMPDLDKDYAPYIYSGQDDPLFKKFGFFTGKVATFSPQGPLENHIVMNRWDPKKKHILYFDKDFPDKYKWIYNDPEKGIITKTNKLFSDHKIEMQFEIQDSDGEKEFGDIRYSFIKLVEAEDGAAPIGYASANTHPLTGEIFSANTVLWTNQLKAYLEILDDDKAKSYLRLESSPIMRNIKILNNSFGGILLGDSSLSQRKDLAQVYRFLLTEFTYGINSNAQDTKRLFAFSSEEKIRQFDNGNPIFKDIADQLALVLNEIEQKVQSDSTKVYSQGSISSVYQFNKASMPTLNSGKPEEFDKLQLLNDILYGVAIHEFGHKLALKHNFYGSLDGHLENIVSPSEIKSYSTSVMDYLRFRDLVNLGYDWQPYDKNALVYAYSDGKITHKEFGNREFAYCSDEHRELNALCNAYDSGSTPSDILLSLIENYDSNYWLENFQNQRYQWNSSDYTKNVFKTMFDIKKFVKLYEDAFKADQVIKALSKISTPIIAAAIAPYLQKDLGKAAALSAAFFQSVITLSAIERPYANSYDDFTGALRAIGIFPDKLFAKMMLMGDDTFPLNPNLESRPVSYLNLYSAPSFGVVIEDMIRKTYVTSGPGFDGFDQLGRYLYAFNAQNIFGSSQLSSLLEKTKLYCFSKPAFKQAFDIDPDNVDGEGQPLIIDVYEANSSDEDLVDDSLFAIARIHRDYYVASVSSNPYGADLIKRGDIKSILSAHKAYYDAQGTTAACK